MSALRITERDGAVTFDIVVHPRASRKGIGPVLGDRVRVSVSAPPVDGKANEAVVRTLSEVFSVPRAAVTIRRGQTGKRKTVRIAGVTAAVVTARLAAAES